MLGARQMSACTTTSRSGSLLCVLGLVAALTGAMPIAPAAAAKIVPHEARYKLSLESLNTDEGFPLEASGAMAIRLTRDCQKWESIREMQFDVQMEGARPISIAMLIRSLEAIDGSRMEFYGWQQDGPKKSLKGTAKMNADGYGGTAYFLQPEESQWDLPLPTRLPVAARKDLIDELAGGESVPQSVAFEVTGISEVIRTGPGKALDVGAVTTESPNLLSGRSWMVDRAFYFETIASNEPFLLETLQIHANGVVSRFWHDYSSVILSGELTALKKISEPDCH